MRRSGLSLAIPPTARHYSTAKLTIPVIPRHEAVMNTPSPDRLDLIFAALADPTRRRVLSMLLEDDMAVSDVAGPFAMSLAAISKHLAVLAAAGLIRQERRGRITWCKLDPDGMRAASVWMGGFGQFDPVDLDDFERFLEAEMQSWTEE